MKRSGFVSTLGLGLALGMVSFFTTASAATYRLAIEPDYPPEQLRKVYAPLINYLNRSTGHSFQLVATRNYHAYWRDLRENLPVDFAYDEAHLVDYRIQHMGFRPVARASEPTRYALVANAEYEGKTSKALIARPVACMSVPSLGFALLTKMFDDNPLTQPDVRSEATSWKEGIEMVFGGEADGAIVPIHLAEIYYNLPTLAKTPPLPGPAFTAAAHIPDEDVEVVKEALTKLHEDPDLYDVLAEIGVSRFVPATVEEYAGNEAYLRGFYGYNKKIQSTEPSE